MKFFEKRPAGAFASSFFISACVLYCVGENPRSIAVIIALLAFAAAMIFGRSFSSVGIRKAAAAISAGILAASLFSVYAIDVHLAGITCETYENAEISGVVRSVVSRSSYSGCYIVEPVDNSVISDDVKLYLACDSGEFAVGDKICFTADISPIEQNEDYKYSLYSDGVFLYGEAGDKVRFSGRSRDIKTGFSTLRDSVSSRLTSEMSDECGGFAKAILLGDRSELSANIKRDFRCLGISHILALSGTHLTVIFALVGKFIPGRGKLRFVRFAVLFAGVVFYMALTGFPSSVVRSGIMFIISAAALLINRKADSFTSLSVSVLVICVVSPYAPFDVGLQLSYAAIAGLLISDGIQKSIGANGNTAFSRAASKIIPSVAVPSVMLPLLWLRFGEASLASPVANLLLIPILVLVLPILLILLAFSFVPGLFGVLSAAAEFVISAMLGVVEKVAESADFMLPLKGDPVSVAVIVFGIVTAIAVMSYGKVRRIAGCAAIMLLPAVFLTAQLTLTYGRGNMSVYYVSSGTDDAVTVMSDGYTVLVDIGMYQSAIMDAADNGYGMRIDALVFTHVHRNHKQTVETLRRNYYLESIWIPVPYSESSAEICKEILKEAASAGISVYSYVPGEDISFGDCHITAPELAYTDESSHPEIVFSVRCEEGAVVYGSSHADLGEVSGNSVRIMGVHGNDAVGIPKTDGYSAVVIPVKCAEDFTGIPDTAVVADHAEIYFDDDPAVSTLRE